MSEVRLVVREAEVDWSGTIHGSSADRAIAALSADPVTLEELELATERFAKRAANRSFLGNLSRGFCTEPYDAGLVVIDLVARMVVVESTYSAPGRVGTVEYHDGRSCTRTALRYHLADDWLFSRDANNWEHVAAKRRRERAAKPSRDARDVFYGQPLLVFLRAGASQRLRGAMKLQRRCERAGPSSRERFAEKAGISSEDVDASALSDEEITPRTWPGQEEYASPFYDTIMQIHANWLLTPREDLGGCCPREVALERHGHLTWDLQDRCEAWSLTDECPRGLSESSDAFRFGGFGVHELVKHYDLVRELLWSCWDRLTELARSPIDGGLADFSTVGDFLMTEIPRLEGVRDAWLDEPDPECHGRTPRSIIARERARLPESMSGHDAMIDPDCPCCQMMGELSGPTFWHLDGSAMDDEFAFDTTHRTREEWEEERKEWAEVDRRIDAEQSERERLGVADRTPRDDGPSAIWSRSYSVDNTADVPLGIRVFGVGCHLAELIVGLRAGADRKTTSPDAQRHIDRLNRDFGNLRELLQSTDPSLAEVLIEPVVLRFTESLDNVATARTELALQCESISDELHDLTSPPSQRPAWDSADPEIPF